jgi:site-specific DNA recombinase
MDGFVRKDTPFATGIYQRNRQFTQTMKEIVNTENQIQKSILAGEYRNSFLVYARKSTDEPNNQKNSIEYQRAENTKFAQREKLPVAPITLNGFCLDGIVSERHSGFKEDNEITITNAGMVQYRIERPKFHRLVQYLSKGLFKGVIVLCWDRISRNRGDDTVVRKLMKTGVEVRFVYANYEKTSAGALHMDIDGMFAEHHSRVTSEKVRITTQNLRDRGICTYKAPLGYLNQGTMEHKPFDPVRTPIIKRMFEILATEEWSLSDLTKWANEQGLTSMPSRRRRTPEEMLAEEDADVEIEAISRPMTVTMVHKLLTNPFYTGKLLDNDGKYVQSQSHEALVTEELFSKAQNALRKRKVSMHYAEKVDLPGRGRIRCADCTRLYTPYIQKGICYFNARCRPNCPNPRRNFSASFMEKEVGKCLERLSFNEKELAEIDARDKSDISVQEEERRKRLDEYARRKRKVREDIDYLRENRLSLLKSGVYSPEGFVNEENKLNHELNQIEGAEQASEASMRETLKDIVKLSELLKHGSAYYEIANSKEKEQFMALIFSELCFSGNTLTYQCKNGFMALQNRFFVVCDQTGWLSEALQNNNAVNDSVKELKELLAGNPSQAP